ncbi:MAG: hypothetical protein M3347_06365 [Armatimonadota bacterium]|nr:hypothetical protein [Armatimonadota bacterium]
MRTFANLILLFFALFVAAAGLYPAASRWLDQPRQREIQERGLEARFSKVQLQNGKVLLVVGEHRQAVRSMDSDSPFVRSLLLSVGSQFRASDRHWGATYTIKSIDAGGVNIYFEADGAPPSSVRPSRGTIKLRWK